MVLRITVRPQGVEPPETPELPGIPEGQVPFDGWNAMPGETGVEAALVTLARARKKAEALQTLDELAPPTPTPTPNPSPQGGGEQSEPDEAAVADDARERAAARTALGVASPKRTLAPPASGGITRDIARGVTEAPLQIVGGIRDAAQAAINLGDWLADKAEEVLPLGGFQLFDDKGAFAPERIPAGDPRLAPDKTGVTLPNVKKPTTTTGALVRGVAQFLAGFAAAGPAAGAVTASLVPRAMIQGALADFTAFEAHDQRLSNLIEEFPALRNPVSAFLAAKPEDGEAEGRLKRAVEGLGLGVTAEGLIRAVRYIRDARRVAAETPLAKAKAAAAEEPAARPPVSLGDESGPLVAKTSDVGVDVADAGGKTRPRTPQEDLGVPDDVVARALTEKGLQPLTEGKNPVYVNFGAFKTSSDVKRAIADTAEAFKGEIDAARRGVRSHEQTAAAAGREDAWKLLEGRRQGEPLNAEQSLAARRLWEGSAEKLIEVAGRAAADATPENLYAFRRMLAIHRDIQSEVIAARTETARALNAWAIPVGSAGRERMASIDNLLITYGGPEASSLLARKVAALRNLPEGMSVLDDVVAKGAFSKTMDVAKEVWVNALLSNPKTHVVNMLGNTIGLGQELIERAAAGAWSRAIGSGGIAPGEAAAKTFALSQGTREGFLLFGKALRTGESQFGAATTKTAEQGFERAISAPHLGIPAESWAGRGVDGLGAIANIPTRFLTAEDDFFKAIGYRTEVAAQAFRQASKEVSEGTIPREGMKARVAALMADPPESIRMAAVDHARYATFTNEPGRVVQAINAFDRKMAASDNPGANLGSLALRMLVPFRNTPGHLLTYAFERTPLAPLLSRYKEAVAAGGAARDVAETRMAMGTMGLLALMDLALDGHVTGAGPKEDKDRGTRDTLMRAGWQPYSVKIGDRYFSYQRTDPFGISLAIASNLAELINNAYLDEDKQENLKKAIAAASFSFGNQMLDKSYLSSVADFMDALHSPDKGDNFANKRLGGFLPGGVNEMRRQADPYMRYAYSLTDEIRNRTPGLSADLPMARDVWGRPRSYQSGLGQIYDALSPIASRKFDPQPIDKAAIENDWNIAPPVPMLNFGKGLSLSLRPFPEAYTRYLELRGQTKPSAMGVDLEAKNRKGEPKWKYGDVPLLDLVNSIVEGKHALSEKYLAAGDGRNGGKDQMITRIISDYGRVAKLKLLDEFPDLQAKLEQKIGRIEP